MANRLRRIALRWILPALIASIFTTAAPGQTIRFRSGPIDPTPVAGGFEGARAIRDLVPADSSGHIVLQLAAAPTASLRAELHDAGVELLAPLGASAYFATVDRASLHLGRLAAIDTLRAADVIPPVAKLHPMLAAGEVPGWAEVGVHADPDGQPADATLALYVMFHRDIAQDRALALITAMGGVDRGRVETMNAMVVELAASHVMPLAASDEVQWIEPALPPLSATNDSARLAVGADIVAAPPYGLDGDGVTVMVYESGRPWAAHDDFDGRLTSHDFVAVTDHATHVSGTIGGSGATSRGQFRGMAPGVEMHAYALQADPGGIILYTNPADIEANYAEAINVHGAVLANNSVGSNPVINGLPCEINGDYGVTAALIDSIVCGGLGSPMRIVFSAGNERGSPACFGAEGFPDEYHSVAPPACAKNHIAVGAVHSNDNAMTSFSSWGPCDDGRLKPDLVAPGCQSNGDLAVTSAWSDGDYGTLCGTSMSAPVVTGLVALLLEDHRLQFPASNDPMPSTIKALLVQTALDLESPGPDYRSGYGLVRIQEAIDVMRAEQFIEGSVNGGETLSYTIEVSQPVSELRVTLAWDDPPGTPNVTQSLVNDLHLRVTGPGGTFLPWRLDPLDPAAAAGHGVDVTNNVEQVVIADPQPGSWTVRVLGASIAEGPQQFSVAASPPLQGTVIDFPDGLPTAVPPNAPTPIHARIRAVGETVLPGSPTFHVRTAAADPFALVPMTPIGADMFEAMLPPAACSAEVEFYFSVNGSISGTVLNPANAPATTYAPMVGGLIQVASFDFETTTGWTVEDSLGLDDGSWDAGVPAGDGTRGDPIVDGDGSGACYLTDNLDGNSDVDSGSTTLVSPVLDATGADATISYYRWFSNSAGANPFLDVFIVEVSDDGGATWTLLESIGPGGFEVSGGWFHRAFAIADIPGIAPTDQFRIRFTAEDQAPGSIIEAAIDGVTLSSFTCDGMIVIGDLDGSGIVDTLDLLALLAAWGPCTCSADLNGDGTVDTVDLLLLLEHWTS